MPESPRSNWRLWKDPVLSKSVPATCETRFRGGCRTEKDRLRYSRHHKSGTLKQCYNRAPLPGNPVPGGLPDRKSTRLNSSHLVISYAVFCLKKKKQQKKCINYVDVSTNPHST